MTDPPFNKKGMHISVFNLMLKGQSIRPPKYMSVISLPAIEELIFSTKAHLFVKKPTFIQDEVCNNNL